MYKVQRDSIVDYATYTDQREVMRAQILAIKRPRRIHLGSYLTFLFENIDTIFPGKPCKSERFARF